MPARRIKRNILRSKSLVLSGDEQQAMFSALDPEKRRARAQKAARDSTLKATDSFRVNSL
jgi:hypothetical protein